jgi:crotonobetainyl-CoA:carnitine CoA-transferase CaiB-like acyl-CoA transferase
MRFSETPVEYTVPPPTLGQHTQEILQDLLGMDCAAVDALAAIGVV